jgi:long-chain acyl-CoA synthetase
MTNGTPDCFLTAWDETLTRVADKAAIFDTRGEVLRKFEQIEARANELERSLTQFEAGDVVAIQIGNHVDWPSLLLACLRRRLVALPLEPTISEHERDAALGLCRAAAVVAPKAVGANAYEIVPRRRVASRINLVNDWADQPPALLKLTSGTTAAPRAIRFRSEQLLADCAQICETMGITERDLNFAVIPVSHSYGFSNLITPLLARGVPMVMSTDRMPRALLDALARTGATIFPGMPVFYQAFCEMENTPALDRLRLCISAGAPLLVAVAQKFREKFKRTIHSFYGCSECGGICYDHEGTTLEEGFVGEPMRGLDLQLLDPKEESSRVCVRSDAVGDGYFPEPEEEKLGHGLFIPDDLLSKSANGFRIVGRVSDVINVAGKKVNPAEVEAELLRCSGVDQAVVFGRESSLRNEEVAACVVASSDLPEAELLEFCRRRLSGWQVPKRIFFVEQIPVNERGKTSRRELARHFAAQNS